MDQHDNVLYYNENKIIDSNRFRLAQRDKDWTMEIYDVRVEDEGLYRCVANTNPIKIKYYQLVVFGTFYFGLGLCIPDWCNHIKPRLCVPIAICRLILLSVLINLVYSNHCGSLECDHIQGLAVRLVPSR